ncbi:major capsid protein [uncultured marine virus]|nr:major capsid protein [uncultured marine virus]
MKPFQVTRTHSTCRRSRDSRLPSSRSWITSTWILLFLRTRTARVGQLEKFNGEQTNPGDSTDFAIPKMVAAVIEGSLADHMGLPLGGQFSINALPFRCYNLIYNEWFRDENLQDSIPENTDDGPDSVLDYLLRRRGKRHDYFTSCLPWPQKGAAVTLPLGTSAPITGIGDQLQVYAGQTDVHETDGTGTVSYANHIESATAASFAFEEDPDNAGFPNIRADLTNATAATINQLRQAFQIQKLLERDARGGTRYTEIIRAHFSVLSPDSRLQRPEYLGGGSSNINITPIAQTQRSDTTTPDETPQGNLAAIGTSAFSGHGFTKSFTEHGYILGLCEVRADLTYQQGIDRLWSRDTRYDFYWPALSHIGEQAVLSKEIFADATAGDEDVFGYQERFAEYRYKPSRISSLFRSNAAASLDVWHLSQDFAARPVLNSTFIEDTPPIDRVIAVTDEPHILLDAYFKLRCARPLPLYGVPGLIDHF